MNNPLITVVIPVWNDEACIARAINSMRNQTYKNLEIIVVDDGSTDGTKAVVQAIAKEDSRVQYHYHRDPREKRTNWRGYDINAGYAARNYGFKLAKGEWITTQDSDDASLLNRVEIQYHLAEKYKAALVTIQWYQLTEANLSKGLDVERVIREKGEASVVIKPETISALAEANRGILMHEPFHRFIPFPVKWFPYTRKLFYRRTDAYPGADNSMMFHRRVRDEGFYFRHRNERTWGVPSGRGSGRDFAFRVAVHFKNSWSFRLPLYLWDVRTQNAEYADYDKYLV
ncbi:MAG: glycosyltransferase family 2 protein [Patescibacteria group bacterium]